jgi:hypothetical protein
VFGGKSYLEASISEIAQKAEVAEGTIYQHFKNKEDLLFFIPNERTNAFCEGWSSTCRGSRMPGTSWQSSRGTTSISSRQIPTTRA